MLMAGWQLCNGLRIGILAFGTGIGTDALRSFGSFFRDCRNIIMPWGRNLPGFFEIAGKAGTCLYTGSRTSGRCCNCPLSVSMRSTCRRSFRGYADSDCDIGRGLIVGRIRVIRGMIRNRAFFFQYGFRFLPCKAGGQFDGRQSAAGRSFQAGGNRINGNSFVYGQ